MTIPRLLILGLLLLVGAITCCTGCSQSVPQKKKFPISNPFYKDRPQRAARMTCFWEPKMLADKQGVIRGFQGEIVFFRDDKMQDSVMVDGELNVYVYDAEDNKIVDLGGVEGIKPLCEYRFNRESLAKGFAKNKKSKMISYGVWLPFDKMPGDEKHLVLWARFDGAGKHGEILGTDTNDQITVYLPGNPVEKKKPEQAPAHAGFNGIQQASYNEVYDFSDSQQSSYAEAVRAMQKNNGRRDSDVIPLSPGLAHRLFNSRPQERQTTPETETPATGMPSRDASPARSVSVGFGGGDIREPDANATPHATSHVAPASGVPSQYPVRNRQNITSIGAQIEQRMMTRNIAEQEQRRRIQEQSVNMPGFTDYNANSFATDQNRFTVPDRYESWGVSAPSQPQRLQGSTGQQQEHFSPNRYPAQNPGTTQSAYVPSDWGPGLESQPSDRQTQVLYSSAAERIYR